MSGKIRNGEGNVIGISNECSNTYSVNDELGSNKLGLFLLLETGTTARGENFLGSIMRGEAGLTVLGDGYAMIVLTLVLFIVLELTRC